MTPSQKRVRGIPVNAFERVIAAMPDLKCDICGQAMVMLHGGGWDNDRIYCTDPNCSAEIVFPTSTEVKL
jgi:hypothetical protein